MSLSQFTLGLAQCCHPEGERYEDVLVMAEKWCEEAKEEGVDILVFPESLMTRYEKDQQVFLSEAQTPTVPSLKEWMFWLSGMAFGLSIPLMRKIFILTIPLILLLLFQIVE